MHASVNIKDAGNNCQIANWVIEPTVMEVTRHFFVFRAEQRSVQFIYNTPFISSAAAAAAGSSMWKKFPQLLLLLLVPLQCFGSAAPACTTAALQQFTVSNTAEALALASVSSCEGGSFTVHWSGVVPVAAPIMVGTNTTLSIVGADQQATASGGNVTSLFQVAANGSLHLERLILADGYTDSSSTGGAVTVQSHASLTAVDCTFERNTAVFGGAIYIADLDFTATGAALSAGLVTLQDCNLTNGVAVQSGGVGWLGTARNLVASGCVFEHNRCTWGGGKQVFRRQVKLAF
jgi:predicted outer membrane repeat protein